MEILLQLLQFTISKVEKIVQEFGAIIIIAYTLILNNMMRKSCMAFYLVKAKPKKELLENLRENLNIGKISKMKPFGESLQYSLENARIDSENPDYALWIEEDYCSPPLAMERESVLDRYFEDISVERVASEKEAWDGIKDNPRLWKK
jgi:hypothetical protein